MTFPYIPLSSLMVVASALSSLFLLCQSWKGLHPQVLLAQAAATQMGVGVVPLVLKEVVLCQKEGPHHLPHSLHPHPVSMEMDLVVVVMHHAPMETNKVSLVMHPVARETGTLTLQQSRERAEEVANSDLCDLVAHRDAGTVVMVERGEEGERAGFCYHGGRKEGGVVGCKSQIYRKGIP